MKKEDEERVERLLNEKAVEQLSAEERDWAVRVLGSEEKLLGFLSIERQLSARDFKSNLEPEKHVLDSLRRRIQIQSQSKREWHSFLSFKTPAYVTALLVIFSSGLAGWVAINSRAPEIVAGATIIKSDTVYVSKIDTVFKEKVIYRQARMIPQSISEIQTARALEKAAPVSTGVSMKDKEELNKLLVSGSD